MLGSENHNDSLQRHFCDAIIRVEGVEFHVHKIILCKCSMYFQALFIRHSTPDRRVFQIPGLSADIMQLIVEFAYTGSVSMTEGNVQQLFQAADQLSIAGIVQACCKFLVETLSTENCIGIWQSANIRFYPELKHKAYHYILNHFEEVVSSEQFQQLSVQELTDIIGRDELNVSQESIVYETVLKWINHAPEERKRHFPVLLSKVRLALTSVQYIKAVRSSMLVRSNKECVQIARHASRLKRHMGMIRPQLSVCSNPIARPRLPNALLFAFGGWSGRGPTNITEVYDIHTNSWINVTDHLERPRAYHGTAFYNGSVYCVGGYDGQGTTNSVRRFDLKTHTWHEVSPMYHRRCYANVTVLNGYIYAIGGSDGTNRLRSAERYNPETNQWNLIASMLEPRSDAGCAVLHNQIYICGGFNGNVCLDTCEYYNPETDQWTSFTAMSTQRSGIGVTAYADHIFAVGGYNGALRLRSVEAYNPNTNTWQAVSSMLTTRSNFGIAVIDNKLFVVGGFNGIVTTNSTEYYDANTGQWSVTSPMEIFRSGLSCSVVSGLPNVEEYVICRDTLLRLGEEQGFVE